MIKVNDTDLQQPMVFDGGLYTQVNVGDEVVWSLTPIRNQTKDVTILSNTTGMTITYDEGYTGLEEVNLVVNVPQDTNNQDKTVTITEDVGQDTNYISAHTSVTFDEGYTGLGDVDVDVKIPCINSQFFGTITANGMYDIGGNSPSFPSDRPMRQAAIQVQVPQSSAATLGAVAVTENNRHYFPSEYNYDGFNDVHVRIDTTPYYNSGYTEGYASGYTSGETEGYSSGYTEGYNEGYSSGSTHGYDEGYASGYTSGVTHQKSLLASTAITANGTYTRENGWNEVSVNVPPATIVTLTQAQYDALDPKDPTTIYLIKD